MAVQHLPARSRAAVPWRNGGGVTREIAAYPPGSDFDHFAWRVSMADIETAGPFSTFAGITRHLTVAQGRLQLALTGQADIRLDDMSDPFMFDGATPCVGTPIGGLVRDVNVMTREGQARAEVRRLAPGTAWRQTPGSTLLLLTLRDGDFTVGGPYTLRQYDALLCDGDGHHVAAQTGYGLVIELFCG